MTNDDEEEDKEQEGARWEHKTEKLTDSLLTKGKSMSGACWSQNILKHIDCLSVIPPGFSYMYIYLHVNLQMS